MTRPWESGSVKARNCPVANGRKLFGQLRSLAEGRTAVFISHRFSTVRKADRIFLFHEGRLAEQGTHAELMRLEGRYAELFTLQASAYLD
jgi:ATP-binding cassette subfamily B protein